MRRYQAVLIVVCAAAGALAAAGCGGGGDGACDPACPTGWSCVGGRCVVGDGGADGDVVADPGDGDAAPPDGDATPPDARPDAADGGDGEAAEAGDGAEGTDAPGEEGPSLPDEDGDTIADAHEGDGAVDTDGDTVPDSRDRDSDGDGIDDAREAGDGDVRTPPVDSDNDLTPDFRDGDSDDDGIDDAWEGAADEDGDGIPNYRDLDSDGDFISDALEGSGDSDGDTVADYLDRDSDGDTISDLDESLQDDDGDGTYNYLDLDSDGDTIGDEHEAGDDDLATPPAKCDGDALENYRDTDSDNDGIRDSAEHYGGPCPDACDPDSDGDGVSDLVEIAYGSNPCVPTESPRTRGDFVFVIPFGESPVPVSDTLSFSTSLKQADVYFLVDTTGSMGGEIQNLRDSLTTMIIPRVRATIASVWFGVGGFDDYPVLPFGYAGDRVFYQEQRMTASEAAAQSAVGRLSVHDGGDRPESDIPALWAVATGGGLGSYLSAQTGCGAGEVGYPCFRSGSVPIVVLITDAPLHNDAGGGDPYSGITPAPPSYAATKAALNAAAVKVLGVNSGDILSRNDLEQLSRDAGAVDRYGTPLVFNINANGSGLGDQVVNAIKALATNVPIRVTTRAVDDPTDTVNATIFIDHIVPNTMGDPMVGCVAGLAAADTNSDGWNDTFTSVLPGTTVCFDIFVRVNSTVASLETPQIFEASIEVVGDGITVLDTRRVYFLVPPVFPGQN